MPVEDTQHGSHFAMTLPSVKTFLLLRNIHFMFQLLKIS